MERDRTEMFFFFYIFCIRSHALIACQCQFLFPKFKIQLYVKYGNCSKIQYIYVDIQVRKLIYRILVTKHCNRINGNHSKMQIYTDYCYSLWAKNVGLAITNLGNQLFSNNIWRKFRWCFEMDGVIYMFPSKWFIYSKVTYHFKIESNLQSGFF